MQKPLQRGITLKEVIVVLVALSALAIVLSTWILRRQVAGRLALCESRLAATARALLEYEEAQKRFPFYRSPLEQSGAKTAHVSWVVDVLPHISHPHPQNPREVVRPYIDYERQYGPRRTKRPPTRSSAIVITEIICPADTSIDTQQNQAAMSVVVNTGLPDAPVNEEFPTDWRTNGVFLDGVPPPRALYLPTSLEYLEANDGAQFTLLLGENVDSGDWIDTSETALGFIWVAESVNGKPSPANRLLPINQRIGEGNGSLRFARLSSGHDRGVNVAYCDGRTNFLVDSIDYAVYVRLMTPSDANLTHPGSDKLIGPPYQQQKDE